tara:strand:+ start:675 stop:986 length:312 start_codon:yes stop_codon:yes gene_type:complete
MGKIFVKDRDGVEHKLKADEGLTIMEIIRDAGLDIEAACGGCCACATCHVYVEDKWLKKLNGINEDEESMLDQAFNVKKESRLGCQIDFNNGLDGIKLTLAPE